MILLGIEITPCVVAETDYFGAVFIVYCYDISLEIGFVEIIGRCASRLIERKRHGSAVLMVDVICDIGGSAIFNELSRYFRGFPIAS